MSGTDAGQGEAQPMEAKRRASRKWSAGSLAGAIVGGLICLAIVGPFLAPYPDHVTGGIDLASRFNPPSLVHIFGTNELGQDMLSLVLAGARVSIFASLFIVCLGAAVGTVAGMIAGYLGGWVEEILMRIADMQLTIPSLILAMAIAAALGGGFWSVVFAVTIAWWPGYARLARGETLGVRQAVYVSAARVMGAPSWWILCRHVAPNIAAPIVVRMALDIGFAILTVASLGFIGIGVKPPTPEWGTLVSTARGYMPHYWWVAIFPGLAIVATVFAFNLAGEAIRERLDPHSGK